LKDNLERQINLPSFLIFHHGNIYSSKCIAKHFSAMLAEMKRPKKYINKWPKIVRQYVARRKKEANAICRPRSMTGTWPQLSPFSGGWPTLA